MANGKSSAPQTPQAAAIEAGALVIKEATKRDPVLVFVLLIGALAMVGTTVWSVHATTSAVSDRPTTDQVIDMIAAHASQPHANAVSRTEFMAVVSSLKEVNTRLADEVQALRIRIDRILDKRGG